MNDEYAIVDTEDLKESNTTKDEQLRTACTKIKEELPPNKTKDVRTKTEEETATTIVEHIKNKPELVDYLYLSNYQEYRYIFSYIYNQKGINFHTKRKLFSEIIKIACENFPNSLFYASANSDIERVVNLSQCTEVLNKTIDGDTPLLFTLKYGDYENINYISCLQKIITNTNINKIDYYNQSPLMIANKIRKESKRQELVSFLLMNGAIVDTKKCNQDSSDEVLNQILIFKYAIQNNEKNFKRLLKEKKYLLNCEDGENTLLQYCILFNRKKLCNILLNYQQVNINGITARNKNVPVLIAAVRDMKETYNQLLSKPTLDITNEIFNEFVKLKPKDIKTEFFGDLLNYTKLDVNMTSDTGWTPLYYAIVFRNTNAIINLLSREASLLYKNKDIRCIDIIHPKDLFDFFNTCIIFDHYEKDILNSKYKLQFDFKCLITNKQETEIIQQLGSKSKFEKLLNHVLIDMLIDIKWFLIQRFFLISVIFRFVHLSLLTGTLIWTSNPIYLLIFCILQYFISYQYIYFRHPKLNNIHSVLETILTIFLTSQLCYRIKLLSAMSYIIMSLSFLLLLGYHPKLSKWSSMIQKVYKQFFSLLIFFLLPIVSFTLGFYELFDEQNFPRQFLSTIIMLTGEFDANDKYFVDGVEVTTQMFFVLFVMLMSIVLMNFWTAIAIQDIDKIEKEKEIASIRNTVKYLQHAELVYRSIPTCFRNYLFPPFLFKDEDYDNQSDITKRNSKNRKNIKFRVDCRINAQNDMAFDKSNMDNIKNLKLKHYIKNKLNDLYDQKCKEEETSKKKQFETEINDIKKDVQTILSILNQNNKAKDGHQKNGENEIGKSN